MPSAVLHGVDGHCFSWNGLGEFICRRHIRGGGIFLN